MKASRLAGGLCGACVLGCGSDFGESDMETLQVTLDQMVAEGTSDLLSHVEDVVVSDDSLWVLNSTEPFFLVFDTAARFGRAWGAQGGGPDEFGDPSTLVLEAVSGRVAAYDGARHEIRLLHPAGSVNGAPVVPAPSPTHLVSLDFAGMGPGRPWIELQPDGVITAETEPSNQGTVRIWRSSLVRSRTALRTDTLLDVRGLGEGATLDRGGAGSLFGPHPLWARCPDQTLVYWDPLRQSLDRFDPEGGPVASTPLPPPEVQPITVERLAAMMLDREAQLAPPDARMDSVRLREALEVDLAGLGDQLSDVFPEYAALECDARGDAWIQPFDAQSPRMGRGDRWIRVGQGRLQRFRFPETFMPFHFGEDEAWGVLTDSLGVPFIARFSLPVL